MNADGSQRTEEGRDGGGYQCDGHRIDQCCRQRMVGSFYEEVLVELQRETCPVAHHLCLGKGEDDDDEDRGIEEQQEQPQITLTEDVLHHVLGE